MKLLTLLARAGSRGGSSLFLNETQNSCGKETVFFHGAVCISAFMGGSVEKCVG